MTTTRIVDVGALLKMDKAFEANVRRKRLGEGQYSVRCKKGLWAVTAPTAQAAEREARHYFQQYYEDGEYGK